MTKSPKAQAAASAELARSAVETALVGQIENLTHLYEQSQARLKTACNLLAERDGALIDLRTDMEAWQRRATALEQQLAASAPQPPVGG